MNRKILSVLLCLCLLFGAASAEDYKDITDLTGENDTYATEYEPARDQDEANGAVENGTYTGKMTVTVTVEEESSSYEPPEYYVELVWGAMYFGYGALEEGYKLWDTETHEYKYQDKDGGEAELGWFLISDATLDASYNSGENGVAWVHQSMDTTQAHVLVFNHSNRYVGVDAQITYSGADKDGVDVTQIDGVTAKVEPVTDTSVTTAPYTVDGGMYSYIIPEGVESTETKDNRWLPETTAVLVVSMEGELPAQYTDKTHVANLNITLKQVEEEPEEGGDVPENGEDPVDPNGVEPEPEPDPDPDPNQEPNPDEPTT